MVSHLVNNNPHLIGCNPIHSQVKKKFKLALVLYLKCQIRRNNELINYYPISIVWLGNTLSDQMRVGIVIVTFVTDQKKMCIYIIQSDDLFKKFPCGNLCKIFEDRLLPLCFCSFVSYSYIFQMSPSCGQLLSVFQPIRSTDIKVQIGQFTLHGSFFIICHDFWLVPLGAC